MKDLYTSFASKVLFPVHERLKGHETAGVLRRMEATQWWSEERLEELRVRRLRGLLQHAQAHVPYYRDLFNTVEFSPGGVRSVDDLQQLPLLTKPDIRANLDRLKADDGPGFTRLNTGGSTGDPLIFFVGKERVAHDVAAKRRATRWWRLDIGDREVVVWGSPIEVGAQDRVRKIRDQLLRTTLLPAFDMSEEKLDDFIRTIRNMRPKMLFGYPSALAHIAGHAEKRGQSMADLGIEVAFVTAEQLYPHQREHLERVFGCRVANGYGGRDAGFIAHECPCGGMHITAEDIIVEIVGRDGRALAPGESGEIVITHLATRHYPFVRYRTGDIGVLDDRRCDCGRGLPMLRAIQGRATDFVVAADGTVMHGLALIYVLRGVPGIKSFKIIQESLRHTTIRLVTEPGFDESSTAAIVRGFTERLGEEVRVDIERVDSIPTEASGKFRYVVSRVAPGGEAEPPIARGGP